MMKDLFSRNWKISLSSLWDFVSCEMLFSTNLKYLRHYLKKIVLITGITNCQCHISMTLSKTVALITGMRLNKSGFTLYPVRDIRLVERKY